MLATNSQSAILNIAWEVNAMKRLPAGCIRCLSLFIAIVSIGCSSKMTIFHADFESDSVGSPPASHPPGAPDKDSITMTPGAATVVYSADLNSKVVELHSSGGWLNINSDNYLGKRYERLRITWTGRAHLDGGRLLIYLDLIGTLNPVAPSPVTINLEDGVIKEYPEYDPTFGSYSESKNQVVSIWVDIAAAKYQISILPGYISEWRPWDYTGVLFDKPTGMNMRMAVALGSGSSSYLMDGVYIYGYPVK